MSVSETTARNRYTGNGATSTYSYTFPITETSDLLVTVRNTSNVETTLVLDTDYSVTGQGEDAGGTVVLINASQTWLTSGFLTSGYILVIRRNFSLTQPADIRNQGDFYPETHEDAFDRGILIDQQQQDQLTRAIKAPETDNLSSIDMTLPCAADRASQFLAFDSSGNPIASAGGISGSLTVSAFMETVLDDASASAALTTLGVSNYAQTLLDDSTSGEALTTLGVSTFAKTVLDDADAATARATLGAVATSGNETVTGTKTFSGQLVGKGTATNDAAAAGYIGEYLESTVTSNTGSGVATGTWFDYTSKSLTAGDWDVTLVVSIHLNGATMTAWEMGISTTTGNSTTGLSTGVNRIAQTQVPTASTDAGGCLASYRMSLASTTTVVAKGMFSFSAGTPQYTCRLSARRVR